MTTFDDYVTGDPDAVSLGRLPCLEDDQGVQLVLTNEAVGRLFSVASHTLRQLQHTHSVSESVNNSVSSLSRAFPLVTLHVCWGRLTACPRQVRP